MLLLLSIGCTPENAFIERPFESIAVVTGDFDSIEDGFNRLDVAHTIYEGYITTSAYDSSVDPELMSLKSEHLFIGVDDDGNSELFIHDAVFVNSGARGFAEVVYKGSLDADDQFVSDSDVIDAVTEFTGRGRTLLASDWAYDLVETAWPDAIDFAGDDLVLDDAEVGAAGRVTATVESVDLVEALGTDTLSLDMNYTNWAVIEDVGPDTEVLLRGDVEYRISAEEGWGTMEDVPLLVQFEVGTGHVVFSSFHWHAQTAGVADAMLVEVVPGLDPGSADASLPQEDTTDGSE
ncbi:MAG: hypothetical protein GY913_29150 [Proteobacteria bacterium]|nr:hypothetical protein [Pseudomonadota bacterium]MCP4920982.1 hypothetical protein [Pseudomonadota bacterium]